MSQLETRWNTPCWMSANAKSCLESAMPGCCVLTCWLFLEIEGDTQCDLLLLTTKNFLPADRRFHGGRSACFGSASSRRRVVLHPDGGNLDQWPRVSFKMSSITYEAKNMEEQSKCDINDITPLSGTLLYFLCLLKSFFSSFFWGVIQHNNTSTQCNNWASCYWCFFRWDIYFIITYAHTLETLGCQDIEFSYKVERRVTSNHINSHFISSHVKHP